MRLLELEKGYYKVHGWTRNDFDHNTTTLQHFQVKVTVDGNLEGGGTYRSGSSYNPQLDAVWTGELEHQVSSNDQPVLITEKYGTHGGHFFYQGRFEGNVLRGTYEWDQNAATGTFEFVFVKN